jgi:hypothetical protein
MKTQPWLPVLTWVVLLSGAVGQAWGQSKCAAGVIYRCVPDGEFDKSGADSVETVNEGRPGCQQTGWVADKAGVSCEPKMPVKCASKGPAICGPKTAVKCGSSCGIGYAQKNFPSAPAKGFSAAEPRKLALPHGSYKRLKACDAPKGAGGCDCRKCDSCQTDCRRDTIFGTETIFGDVSLGLFRNQHPCPYECTCAGRPKSMVQVLSKLDASLQKVFVCRRGTCGSANCKGTGDCQCKANGKGDMGTAPILEGQPEEPEQEGNPFHDDAVEPAPLPPMPQMTSAASNPSQLHLSRPPLKLVAIRAKPVSSHSAPPTRQADSLTTGEPTPATQSAKPLLTSTQLD